MTIPVDTRPRDTPAYELLGPQPLELEYVFSVSVEFEERVRFETPAGKRIYVPATGGYVWGPRLQGRVVPRSGGDYADVYGLNAHYMLETTDGSPIYVNNTGFLYPIGNQEIDYAGDPRWGGDGEFYFRLAPKFDAPVGEHDWLTRTLIVGTGQRHADPDHTVFTYYAVR